MGVALPVQPRNTLSEEVRRNELATPKASALRLPNAVQTSQALRMIITHTVNAEGQRRVYLGGKSSMECWIEPQPDGVAWTFHTETAPGRFPLADDEAVEWMSYTRSNLARDLGVTPDRLDDVAFDRIAALHTTDGLDHRRVAVPRKQRAEHGFIAAKPIKMLKA